MSVWLVSVSHLSVRLEYKYVVCACVFRVCVVRECVVRECVARKCVTLKCSARV